MKLTELIAPCFYDVHKALKKDAYGELWLKGGRGSTKSSFISIEIILGIIRDSEANAVILRRYQNELRDTVYGQFEWAIAKMGFSSVFRCMVSPMQIIYIPTGQKIIFKAADNPAKVKSVNFGKGYVKYLWSEEVDQFSNMSEIRNIMQSMFRGGEHKRIALFSFNPPKSARSWVNQETKIPKADRLVHHSDYTQIPAEWLGERFIAEAEHLQSVNESSYRHEYLGEETGTGLEVFNNLEIRAIADEEIDNFSNIRQGLDFGYAVDPVAFNRCEYDSTRKTLYLFDEFNGIQVSNRKLYENIKDHDRFTTFADSAEPKSIAELKDYGMKVRPVKKGADSVEFGIKFLQDLEKIVIDPARCPHTCREFTNYALEVDNHGYVKSRFPDKDNHHIDSVRYATRDDQKPNKSFGW